MAAAAVVPAPALGAWDFKGNPQPPIDDRLSAARNFLSDEDPDRCLQFDEKLAEIEELIADVKKQALLHDTDLLHNVEIKIKEHHAWKKFHAGWTDTNCSNLLPKIPYSTRLIDAKTSTSLTDRQQQLGIEDATRSDAPPFTTEREEDHSQFMHAMKAAASQDPSASNLTQNLIHKEHRAYDWAIRDPSFIPLWLHPTKGIPKTGTTDADEIPWYRRLAAPPAFAKLLPDRGYIPDYLVAREKRINALLKAPQHLTSAHFKELDDLLSEHYPEQLQVLWDQYEALVKSQTINMTSTALVLRNLTPQEISHNDQIKAVFDQKHEEWVKSFAATGVYIMVRKRIPGNIEVDAPGVFYVDDGVISGDRAIILRDARSMLDFVQMNGSWASQNLTQDKQMGIIVHDSQPQSVKDLDEQRDAILHTRGVSRPDGLEQSQRQLWDQVDRLARTARATWLDQAIQNGTQFELQYLRPGEMKETSNPGLIYLPWHIIHLPDGQTPDPPVVLPPEVKTLETKINARMLLLKNNNMTSLSLSCKWGPRAERNANSGCLSKGSPSACAVNKNQGQDGHTQVSKLWEDWLSGFDFGAGIRLKLPTSHMPADSPDILYYGAPVNGTVDPASHMHNSEQIINEHELPCPWRNTDAFQQQGNQIVADLEVTLEDFRYPELRKAKDDADLCASRQHDDYRNKVPPLTVVEWTKAEDDTRNIYRAMRDRWFRRLQGHVISIRRPIPSVDPDSNPSVVYVRGALPEPGATKTVRDCMDVSLLPDQAVENLKFFYDVDTDKQLFPEYIKYLQGIVASTPGDRLEQDALTWNFDYLVHGPLTHESTRGFVDELGVWRCSYVNGRKRTFNRGGLIDLCKLEPAPSLATGHVRLLGGAPGAATVPPVLRTRSRTTSTNANNSTYRGLNRHPLRTANGYFTRPPCRPRTAGMHPEYGVDLELFRDQITYVERELNMMCQLIRAHQRPGNPDSAIQVTRRRFYNLIEQFVPQPFVDLSARDRAFARTVQRPAHPASKKDRVAFSRKTRVLESMRQETAGLIDAWIQSLIDSHFGVYIDRSENLEDKGDEKALILNRQFTKEKQNFKFVAPRDTSPSTPLLTGDLMVHTPQPRPNIDLFATDQRFQTNFIARIRVRINELLVKRKNNTHMNWEDSEELLDKLSGFMLPGLSTLESEVWQLDDKLRYIPPPTGPARLQPPTADDVQEYLRLNDRWQAAYDSWLDTLPTTQAGIVIQNNRTGQPAPGELFFEDPNFWDHWPSSDYDVGSNIEKLSKRRPARSKVLPQFILDNLRDVNTYLRGTQPLSRDPENTILRAMVRQGGQKCRALSYNALQVRPNDVLRPEFDVVIEITQTLGFRTIKQRMRDAMAAGSDQVHIVEYGAGRYINYFGAALASLDNLTSPFPPGYSAARAAEATAIWRSIWEHPLFASERTNFLAFAARIRNLNGISNADLKSLLRLLSQTSSESQTVRGDALYMLYHVGATWPTANAATFTRYQQSFLINRFERMHPKILEAMVVGPILLAVDQLTRSLQPGEYPRPRVLDIAKPSRAEVRQLEIEINNLLYRERNGVIQPRDAAELDYLLESFLPIDVEAIKSQVEKLEADLLQLPRLTANEEFSYRNYLHEYVQRFAAFKRGIGPAGIFLDKWWYTEDKIAKGCSRARMWTRATMKDRTPGVFPTTSPTLEDEDMRQWQEIYLDLRDYFLSFKQEPDREKRLFFDILPTTFATTKADVKNLKSQFAALFAGNASPSDKTVLTEAAHLQDVMRQFVTLWTGWLVNTPATNIPVLRKQIRDMISSSTRTSSTTTLVNQGTRVPINFGSKAERRGIRRAAIELALKILATNQEQHRPSGIYRRVDLPGPYRPLDEGMPLSLPLKPWNRPVELDTFEYTKRMLDFHQSKNKEFIIARAREIDIHPGEIPVPPNFNGPFARTDAADLEWAKREWLRELVGIFRAMQDAYALAPRPFLQELLNCVGQGFALNPTHQTINEAELNRDEIRLMAELTESSWDDVRLPYPTLTPNTTGYDEAFKLQSELKAFEKELDLLDWQDRTWAPAMLGIIPGFAQPRYDAKLDTTQGYSISVLTQHINNGRLSRIVRAGQAASTPAVPALLSQETVVAYCAQLQKLRRIHKDSALVEPYDTLIAKIPMSGHPENKYIVSRRDAQRATGVSLDPTTNSYVVQYDAKGTQGPPILQPNKVSYFQSIAYRIGRDTELALRSRIGPNKTPAQFLTDRYRCLSNTEARIVGDRPDHNMLNLQDIAMELHQIAPELAGELGIRPQTRNPLQPDAALRFNDRESAMLIQMQILEELNNSWEARFPENERLWDFAFNRVLPQTITINGKKIKGARRRIAKYFDVRRFPPGCQEPATQAAILKSGPEFNDRAITPPDTPPDTPGLGRRRRRRGDDGGGGGHVDFDDDDDDDDDNNGNGNNKNKNKNKKLVSMGPRRRVRFNVVETSSKEPWGTKPDMKEIEDQENNELVALKEGDPQTSARNKNLVAQREALALQASLDMKKQARHLMGSRPHFPLGETPYQQAYQSFLMEHDLRDVAEFQPVAPRAGLFERKPSPEPTDPFALPPIPDDWEPDNISSAEK